MWKTCILFPRAESVNLFECQKFIDSLKSILLLKNQLFKSKEIL